VPSACVLIVISCIQCWNMMCSIVQTAFYPFFKEFLSKRYCNKEQRLINKNLLAFIPPLLHHIHHIFIVITIALSLTSLYHTKDTWLITGETKNTKGRSNHGFAWFTLKPASCICTAINSTHSRRWCSILLWKPISSQS